MSRIVCCHPADEVPVLVFFVPGIVAYAKYMFVQLRINDFVFLIGVAVRAAVPFHAGDACFRQIVLVFQAICISPFVGCRIPRLDFFGCQALLRVVVISVTKSLLEIAVIVFLENSFCTYFLPVVELGVINKLVTSDISIE